MSAKSQFLATNGGLTEGENLLGSITLAFKDTRNGFDAQTRQLVEQLGTYADSNQGKEFTIQLSAATYLSFFDPAGPALISKNAPNIRGAKLLWVVGTSDAGARQMAKGGTVITVNADHFHTPTAAASQIVSWLESQ